MKAYVDTLELCFEKRFHICFVALKTLSDLLEVPGLRAEMQNPRVTLVWLSLGSRSHQLGM